MFVSFHLYLKFKKKKPKTNQKPKRKAAEVHCAIWEKLFLLSITSRVYSQQLNNCDKPLLLRRDVFRETKLRYNYELLVVKSLKISKKIIH